MSISKHHYPDVAVDCTSAVYCQQTSVTTESLIFGYLVNVTYGKERMGNGVFGWHQGVLARKTSATGVVD
jgi:hypothetical protein